MKQEHAATLVLDASPLIYLAKLDALDVFSIAGYRAAAPPGVAAETTASGLAFRHPDAGLIAEAFRAGTIDVMELTGAEAEEASRLRTMAGGLSRADADVVALGAGRSLPVCLSERQASRLARSLGVEVVGLVQLLFAGTEDVDVMESRVRGFATLTQLRIADLDQLLAEVARRRT